MAELTKREQDSLNKKTLLISEKSKEAVSLSKEIKTSHKKYTNIINQLEELKQQAELLTKDFNTQKKQVESNLNQAELFYSNKFSPLKDKIENKETGLKNTLDKSVLFIKEIAKKRDQLATANTKYQGNVKEIQSILTKARRIDKSASSSNDSIAKHKDNAHQLLEDAKKILSSINDNKDKVISLNQETNKLLNLSQKSFGEIEDLKQNSSVLNKNIQEIEQSAISTNEKITKLYEIVTNKSMAGAFDERRRALIEDLLEWNKKVKLWSVLLFVTVLILLFIQIGFNKWTLSGLGYDFYLRFLFAGPVLYYLVFCNAQYNNVRNNLDRYTFKTSIALSIEAHTELLSNNFSGPEHTEKILTFSLESLNKIYDKPYHDELAMAMAKSHNCRIEEKQSTIENILLSKDNDFLKAFNSALQLIKGKVKP
jgi:ABC-type transporter Mla subunit MlaD